MLDKPISPVLQRMIDDMTARRFKQKVQKGCVRHVGNFTAFFGNYVDSIPIAEFRDQILQVVTTVR